MSILGSTPDFEDAAKKLALNITQYVTRDQIRRYGYTKDLIQNALELTFSTGIKWGATAMKEHNDIAAICAEANLLVNKEDSNG